MKSLEIEAQKRPSPSNETEGNPKGLSKNKLKRLKRNPKKDFSRPREIFKYCKKCPNPAGTKCDSELCRICCHAVCFDENLDCLGHNIRIKTKRQKAKEIQS